MRPLNSRPRVVVVLLVAGRRARSSVCSGASRHTRAPWPRAPARRARAAPAARAERRRGLADRPRPARARRRDRRRSARPGTRARRPAWRRRSSRARPATRAGVAEDVRGRHGRGEVQRRHGGERIARRGHRRAAPSLDFQNCSPYSTIIRRSSGVRPSSISPRCGGVPRRRGRDRPVADHAEVERRVDRAAAPRGNCSRWRSSTYGDGPVREREPDPVRPDQRPSPSALKRPGVPNARCSRSVGVVPPPISLSTLTGIVDPHPRARARSGRRWASGTWPGRPTSAARTSPTSRARERGTRTQSANGVAAAAAITTGGLRRSRRRSERRREAGGEHRAGGRADGGRAAHGAASITGPQADT